MNLCNRAKAIFRKLATYMDDQMSRHIAQAIGITSMLRELISREHPPRNIVGLLIERIPDRYHAAIAVALEIALNKLIGLEKCSNLNTLEERLACYIVTIKTHNQERIDAETLKLASLIARWMDNRFEQHIYDTATQVTITEMKLS